MNNGARPNRPVMLAGAFVFGSLLTMSAAEIALAADTATAPPTADSMSSAVAGDVPLGVTVVELRDVVGGWSVKRSMLGKAVHNDANQNIGTIQDLIVTSHDRAAVAIIGVGGFLGMGEHLVAIPMRQIKYEGGRFVLPGATKNALKAMPAFEYGKS